MLEKLKEIRSLVIEKKNDEAVEKLDELIAATPAVANCEGKEEFDPKDPPLPGNGNNGRL